MSLVVLTGGARCGKSAAALTLVEERCDDVVVAVAAHSADDHEMARRIERHRLDRPAHFTTLEVGAGAGWVAGVPADACLVVDCLGSIAGTALASPSEHRDLVEPAAETDAQRAVDALVDALLARSGDTVVVTNEVGDGIVPAFPAGRLFRDLLGRANRRLVDAADAAYLVVAGRCIDLASLPMRPTWPGEDR